MDKELQHAKEEAREMILDGETGDKIREKTRLREKDVKRIQKEITNHF